MVFSRKPDLKSADIDGVSLPPLDHPAAPEPPPPRPPWAADPSESVIGSDLTIEGQTITIRCKGSLRVNGNIQADLHSVQLTVGEEAAISGSIAAETVEVYGKVQGAIHASRVVLYATAHVEGDIHSQYLSIEEGASFEGRSRKVRDAREIAPQMTSTHNNGAPPSVQQSIHQIQEAIQLS